MRDLSEVKDPGCGQRVNRGGIRKGEVPRELPSAWVRKGIWIWGQRDAGFRSACASFRAARLFSIWVALTVTLAANIILELSNREHHGFSERVHRVGPGAWRRSETREGSRRFRPSCSMSAVRLVPAQRRPLVLQLWLSNVFHSREGLSGMSSSLDFDSVSVVRWSLHS